MKLSHILRQQFKLTKECLTNVIANSLMWESPKHINLLTEESFNYNLVRMAILKSYEFVPEAYQQKFKNHKNQELLDLCGVFKAERNILQLTEQGEEC